MRLPTITNLLSLLHITSALQFSADELHKKSDDANSLIEALLSLPVDSAATPAGSLPLHIMPLGASITAGQASTDGNGYRKHLRDSLHSQGWDVSMVGVRNVGSMNDNNVSAVPGYTIDQVRGLAVASLKFQPNIVLINAGTNDCVQEKDMANAPKRMEALLDELFDGINGTMIVLSTLLPSTNKGVKEYGPAFNEALRTIVKERRRDGEKIVLADMDLGNITVGNLVDGIHPNDHTYGVMAGIWLQAINQALEEGLVRHPKQT